MRLLRPVVAVVLTGLSGLALPHTATGQADVQAKGLTIAASTAPAGTRTVCLGGRDGRARVVGCFDVYRIESGKVTDPVLGVDLARYLWKFTAAARADTPEGRLVRLVAGVASDAGSTYDWAPE
ncbi:MAG: hypothetical protein ACRDY7_06330, partial [Acidimicrobiia bacterium]